MKATLLNKTNTALYLETKAYGLDAFGFVCPNLPEHDYDMIDSVNDRRLRC